MVASGNSMCTASIGSEGKRFRGGAYNFNKGWRGKDRTIESYRIAFYVGYE